MNKTQSIALSAALLAATLSTQALAATASELTPSASSIVRITEVAPWSSGNSSVADDWFELTNVGDTAINVAGWKMDDNSYDFTKAVTLNGITTIAAHESVIFIETGNSGRDAAGNASAFVSTWFGGTAPAGLQIGNYTGSGVGLSTSGDAVTIFDSNKGVQAVVAFGNSPTGPYTTFDNAAGQNGGVISLASVVGTNSAFVAAGDSLEIGSPGTTAAVPEPETYAMLLAGLGLLGFAARRRGK